MRTFLVLVTIALIVAAVAYRDRLFLRDPLGKITRDGVVQDDARVFINYSNDVLVREKHGTRMFVVQHWERREAEPAKLTCVEGMLCVTPSDMVVDAGGIQAGSGVATMTDRQVSFRDREGQAVVVTIR